MPRKRSICTHPKRTHINRALMNPKRSLRKISAQYGVSPSTLQRHKKTSGSRRSQDTTRGGKIAPGQSSGHPGALFGE